MVEQCKEKIEESRKIYPKFNNNYKSRFDPILLEKFSKKINSKAKELKIFPEVLAGKKDLLALIQKKDNAKLLTGWRNKIIGAELSEDLKNL